MIMNTITMASSMARPSWRKASAWSSLAPPSLDRHPGRQVEARRACCCTVLVSAPRLSESGVAVRVTARVPSIWVTVLGASSCFTSATSETWIGPARMSAMSACSSARSVCSSPSAVCSSASAFCSSVSVCCSLLNSILLGLLLGGLVGLLVARLEIWSSSCSTCASAWATPAFSC